MSVRPLSVSLGIPAYRSSVNIGHVYAMASLATFVKVNNLFLHLNSTDSSSLDWCRNMLLDKAIKQESEWCLMVDADTYYPDPVAIYRMLADGNRQGAAVIAAPVRMRGRPGFNVQVEEPGPDGKPVARYVTDDELKGKVRPVSAIGTAFFAIRCGFAAKMERPWFQTMQYTGPDGMPAKTGEDFNFCYEVRRRGGVVLADGRFEPAHVHATSETAIFAQALGAEVYEAAA